MSTLPAKLRGALETAAGQARKIAESGARKALEALAVHEPDPYRHMNEAQRALRNKLRAQARQLGDGQSQVKAGAYEIKHLVEKLAYDQWHRLLFARFLLENNLLISPEHEVSVTLEDCEELAPSLGLKDAWTVAARFAAKELPEIFRADDPVGAVELPVEDRKPLIQLVTDLPVEVFTASDSLGWCYQFWQAARKEEVNKSGNKIGADELPSVTQLFTEDYMVDFLLDNTLGAWHAGKVLAANPKLAENAQSEDELRQAVALPGCPWKYLRFIREPTALAAVSSDATSDSEATEASANGSGAWRPAAGTFDGWPKTAKELKCLDPCMGSGHFVVAMFERLVALRIAEEKLDETAAVAAVIRDNLFGLEIDPRCTQIGAFNLALAAWRRVGHCKLPAMNLACSGLAPNTREADWLAIAGNNEKLKNGMERLYRLFQKAAVLGSLINPRAGEGDLLVAAFHELQPLLEKALAQETTDDTTHEMAVTARGLAKAAEMLAGRFTLVATNVPYLGRSKQDEVLEDYCKRVHMAAKADLSTCFVERCIDFCTDGGSTVLVTPQNWLFLGTYRRLRESLLRDKTWNFAIQLGANAFQDMNWWAATTALVGLTAAKTSDQHSVFGIDVTILKDQQSKAALLRGESVNGVTCSFALKGQAGVLSNPDARISLLTEETVNRIAETAGAYHGQGSRDSGRFMLCWWELQQLDDRWVPLQTTVREAVTYGGAHYCLLWERGEGQLAANIKAYAEEGSLSPDWSAGLQCWGRPGVLISQTGQLLATMYLGHAFDSNSAVIQVYNPEEDGSVLPALWCFCSSPEYPKAVRQLDQALKVTNASLSKVSFDLAHWQKVAAEKYPHGLPKPFSSDPTQWLFNGHPAGADQPLHVAVARLLGYQWPRQTGSIFPDCPALGPDGLEKLADDDGIVCLSSTKGDAPGAERLRVLLSQALGPFDVRALLANVGPKGSKSETLEDWLRDEFFEQHCALFHNRPFIWHIWDGHKSGFSALVNYHKLDHAHLEKLTYAYLGDWIRRQQAAVEAGESGSDARLAAAKLLQSRLKLILEGEPPFDLFVRWKPLSQQAIGWHPDLNDGVRMNIRPFLAQDIPGGKKGAGILRAKPGIKWDKDRGKEPVRDKKEFPWFWGWDEKKQDFAGVGQEPDGNRWNDCHYTNEFKNKIRKG